MEPNIQNIEFMKLEEVKVKSALSRSTIYRMMADGKFPQQIPLGDRSVAWSREEINNWCRERLERRGVRK